MHVARCLTSLYHMQTKHSYFLKQKNEEHITMKKSNQTKELTKCINFIRNKQNMELRAGANSYMTGALDRMTTRPEL